MLPFDVFASDVLAGYVLFEFVFILDFSIYSIFIQLFVVIFHWKKILKVQKQRLNIPILIINVLLFTFFFVVVGIYAATDDLVVQQNLVLAYRVVICSIAFVVVLAFLVYGMFLVNRLRKKMRLHKAQTKPVWLDQLRRLSVVALLATCGILAIFIVVIYSAQLTIPDPVLSSTAWVICFLFFAEFVPLFFIVHDIHRTALVEQEEVLRELQRHRTLTQSVHNLPAITEAKKDSPKNRRSLTFMLPKTAAHTHTPAVTQTTLTQSQAEENTSVGEILDHHGVGRKGSVMREGKNSISSGKQTPDAPPPSSRKEEEEEEESPKTPDSSNNSPNSNSPNYDFNDDIDFIDL